MADENVSFTDAGDPGNQQGKGGNSSAMLDLLGTLNKEEKKKGKKEKAGKKGKKEKSKTKKVRKADKFESQNFLFRIEGTVFCAGIIIGIIALLSFLILGIIFAVITNGNLVSYMAPWWGGSADNSAEAG